MREAILKDTDCIINLYSELTEEQDYSGIEKRILEINKSKHEFLFVVDINGNAICTIFLLIGLNGAFSNSKFAILENFIVKKEYRHRGIGTHVLHEIELFCLENGCTKIMMLSGKMNTEAHSIIRKAGFDDSLSLGFKKYIFKQ